MRSVKSKIAEMREKPKQTARKLIQIKVFGRNIWMINTPIRHEYFNQQRSFIDEWMMNHI